MRAAGERKLFTLFCRVRFHDADPAERFSEPSGYERCDLSAFAKHGPQDFESVKQSTAKDQEHDDGGDRQLPVQVKKHTNSDNCRNDTSDYLPQPSSD